MSPDRSTLSFTPTAPGRSRASGGSDRPAGEPMTFRPAALARQTDDDGAERDRSARAAGYAAGWAAGARAAAEAAAEQQQRLAGEHARREAERDAQVAAAVESLHRAASALAATTAPVLTECTTALHEAALALAEAVLRRELTPGPGAARALLARARELPAEHAVHTVRVSPQDHVHVTAVLAEQPELLPEGVAVVADPTLATGDVVSEHPTGYLDGQVAHALDRARRALEGAP